jgi:hypothetical protein
MPWRLLLAAGALNVYSALAASIVQSGIPSTATFEQTSDPRYTWRNRKNEAILGKGGAISLRLDHRRLGIAFEGANAQTQPSGEGTSYPVSYYRSKEWHTARRWERVRYRALYPGIDLVLVTNAGQLEYNLEVSPQADPGAVKIRYRGAPVHLDSSGDLLAAELLQHRPFAFQENGMKVECSYRLARNTLTLQIGNYDRRRPLIIDPVLHFSTYLGGPSYDTIYALTTDSGGNIYVAGETNSGSMPGGTQAARPNRDAWVAKLASSGSQLLYLVYLGGSGNDSARGIAVDASGNAYITGVTSSSNFPTSTGAFSTQVAGFQEAFVAKLNSNGQIQYSTYLGGGSDAGFAIAVDGSGQAYVGGQTGSFSFPATAGAMQSSNQGGISDCFVSKLNAAGSALSYSTYLGGSALDLCSGLAIDASGDAFVTGTTYSSNFPTHLPLQSALLGAANAFVAELNPAGSALVYSTYLGGSSIENGNAIAVDSSGAVYVTGTTSSPNFPVTSGTFQATLKGSYNAFVSKLAPGGASLAYSTFLGGSGMDNAMAIALDGSGQAVVAGYTTSPNLPVTTPIQGSFQGVFDGFATVLNMSGSGLVFSSFFGGNGDDRAYAVSALPGSVFTLGGWTSSSDFPSLAPLQASAGGTYDGFVLSVHYDTAQVQPGQSAYFPIPPCRISDTRTGSGFSGSFGAPSLKAGVARSFPIPQSPCGVPSNAIAYSLNVTVVAPAKSVNLIAWPTGLPTPATTTVNSPAGGIVGNAAIVSAGIGGAISLEANNAVDVVIDINGYFAPVTAQGMVFYPMTPCRVADTRSGSKGSGLSGAFGPPTIAGGSIRTFPMLSSNCRIPSTAQAYSVRMTIVPPGPVQYLTSFPAGQSLPLVSTLNAPSGGVIGNAAIVPAGTKGAIDVFVSNTTDLVIDINGYFAPPGNPGALFFYSLAPCRVADTRANSGFTGAFGPPSFGGGTTRVFPMQSACNIPASAQAYSLNMTVVSKILGYLTAWPAGQPLPLASTLNALTGGTVSAAALVPGGTAGGLSVFASNLTDLIIDIGGYFAP